MSHSIRISAVLGLAAGLSWVVCGASTSWTAEENEPKKTSVQTPIGDALGSALKPGTQKVRAFPGTTAPGAKGLIQQPVWKFGGLKKDIQLAFVLDATNSMKQDIDSLKNCLRDVIDQIKDQVTDVRSKDDVKVWVAVVIYRDWWREPQAPPVASREIRVRFVGSEREEVLERRESPVKILTGSPGKHFIDIDSDLSGLQTRLQEISPEVGHPGSEEQVDLGIGTALKDLDWMAGDKVSRLLVVAGDSPPWQEEYLDWTKNPAYWTYWEKKEPQPQPLRTYATRELVKLAREKDVNIFALGCDRNTSADHRRLVQMRSFFLELTQQTNGKFLDLSDSNVKDQLKRAVQSGGEDRQDLRPITRADLEKATSRPAAPAARVAILPPLDKVDYRLSYEDDAYHVAALLTKQVQDLDPLLAVSSDQVRRTWLRLSPDGAVTTERRAALASELGVSFVIWGALRPADGRLSLDLAAYGANGQVLVESETARADLLTVAEKAWKGLLIAAEKNPQAESLAKTFSQHAITTDLVQTPDALRELLKGYGMLEEATQFASNDPASQRLNEEALQSLQVVLRSDPDSVFAKLLLASCQLNLKQSSEAKSTLTEARKLAESLPADEPLRLEVEADHAWYVQSDARAAIKAYQQILETTVGRYPRVALRARWTLAGYYLSPLPQISEAIPDEVERLDLARKHILEVLMNWRDSPEARFYEHYVQPPLSPRQKPNGPVRVVEIEHKISVPLIRPKTLLGGL